MGVPMEVQIPNNGIYVYGYNLYHLYSLYIWLLFDLQSKNLWLLTLHMWYYIRRADQKAQSLGHGLLNFIIEKACP